MRAPPLSGVKRGPPALGARRRRHGDRFVRHARIVLDARSRKPALTTPVRTGVGTVTLVRSHIVSNHSETLVRSHVVGNHNETLVRSAITVNHNEMLVRR